MSDHEMQSIEQKQKKTRPKIEDLIPIYLDGRNQQSALSFVTWLRMNKISLTWISANVWKCSYKGQCLFYIRLNNNKTWGSFHIRYDNNDFETFELSNDLREFFWANPNYCRQTGCHYRACAKRHGMDAETYTGVKKMVLGKEIENMCWVGGILAPENPNEQTLEIIKKIIGCCRHSIENKLAAKNK